MLQRVLRSSLVPAVLVGMLLAGASTLASRPPTKSERAAILALAGQPAYPKGWYKLVVRVSTVNSRWAIVFVRAREGHEHQVQPDWKVFHKRHKQWHLYGVHCLGVTPKQTGVPAKVVNDLKLPLC